MVVMVAIRLDKVVSLFKPLQTDGALAVRDVSFRQTILGHLEEEELVTGVLASIKRHGRLKATALIESSI